jgi:hypothetical protein
VTDGSSEFREAFDAIIPEWQFAACESDIPSLSRPYRFVERGISLGAVVIEQRNHLFPVRGMQNLRTCCIDPILGAGVSKKVRPSLQARRMVGREAGIKPGPAEERSTSLAKNAKDMALAQRECVLAGLFASGRVYQKLDGVIYFDPRDGVPLPIA